jgi:hypothetical protein
MQTWVEVDDRGREYVVRAGTGVVTAVVPLGEEAPAGGSFLRVEIYCDAPHGRPGAIRYSAHPLVVSGTPLHRAAVEALTEVWPVAWTVAWHRHDWIPDHLPIASLSLASDAVATLTALDRVVVPEPVADLDLVVPWTDLRADRP